MMSEASFSPLFALTCLAVIAPLLTKSAEVDWKHRINVSQSHGVDEPACSNGSIPCKSLDFALQYVADSTLVQVQSSNSPYNLTQNFTFRDVHGFGIVGEALISVKCESRGSLYFENCINITIRGITLEGCGGLHESTVDEAFERTHIPFLSAVFFVYCKNIAIDHCRIDNSPGIGLNMYDIGGDVRISNCRFENNRPNENSTVIDIAIAGGGVYMELTKQGGMFPFNVSSSTLAEYDNNSSYTFLNCSFKGNSAPDANVTYKPTDEKPLIADHNPFGRGGGLSIFLRGEAENNIIRIDYCQFESNHATWGGGAYVAFHNQVQNNTLEVVNCNFINNFANLGGGGFGSRTATEGHTQWLLANKMKYANCIFERNQALIGGGVSYSEFISLLYAKNNELTIEYKNCMWNRNAATQGSAIFATTIPFINVLPLIKAERPGYYSILLEDCKVTYNRIVFTVDEKWRRHGAIISYSLPIIFNKTATIEHNVGTAMIIENAVLRVFDNVTFRNNSGTRGGALGLYSSSVIMLMPHSQISFINNTAKELGGALYAKNPRALVAFDKLDWFKTNKCFIAYNNSLHGPDKVTEWKTRIVFSGNTVSSSGGGKSVYASSLQGCQKGQPLINNDSLAWPNIIEYQDSENSFKGQISTDPVSIYFNASEWEVSPSELFDASIKLMNEKNCSVTGTVKVTIIDDDHNTADRVSLGTVSDLFLVQADYPKISNLSLKGKVGRSLSLTISTTDGRVRRKCKRKLTLKKCRPGFEQTDSKTCSCISTKREPGISHCSADSKHVFLKTGYWGGMIGDNFTTYPCPPHYCKITNNPTFIYSPETMCTEGRNGSSVLCGQCKNNFSLNLGNEECKETCSTKDFVIAIVALAGFCVITPLLVLVVFCMDFDIFTTYLNSCLYSYQIISFLLVEGQSLDKFISFIIAFANGRVEGVFVCLYNSGMNNLEKLGINYVFPVYILLLVFVLAKITRYRPACFINRNAAHALCTLLVLCYTTVTMISFKIVGYIPLQGRWVLYADGNIDFTTDWKEHLPFTVIACLWIACFVALFPLQLLWTPWFFRHVPKLNRLRLFFDTFQQCFKDQYRWFAAYYFICRIWVLMIALLFPVGPLQRSVLEASCIITAAVCLYLQPYNEQYQWLNRLDAVLLTNLCLVVCFSSGVRSGGTESFQSVLVNVLAYIPLVCVIGIVCYQGWKYYCSQNCTHRNTAVEEDLMTTSETSPLIRSIS